ncbi:hypothetical protein WMF26_16165 [Sorangium sp. So ce185]|uniref:DUF2515 family protein n=1 Tax=Sorangium sp. So ce185 TaxID=3133287 RepID=UPI003F5FC108
MADPVVRSYNTPRAWVQTNTLINARYSTLFSANNRLLFAGGASFGSFAVGCNFRLIEFLLDLADSDPGRLILLARNPSLGAGFGEGVTAFLRTINWTLSSFPHVRFALETIRQLLIFSANRLRDGNVGVFMDMFPIQLFYHLHMLEYASADVGDRAHAALFRCCLRNFAEHLRICRRQRYSRYETFDEQDYLFNGGVALAEDRFFDAATSILRHEQYLTLEETVYNVGRGYVLDAFDEIGDTVFAALVEGMRMCGLIKAFFYADCSPSSPPVQYTHAYAGDAGFHRPDIRWPYMLEGVRKATTLAGMRRYLVSGASPNSAPEQGETRTHILSQLHRMRGGVTIRPSRDARFVG